MLLKHLSLTNFRNFARLDIDVPGGSLLLVGGNAQGKTSLLEAVYYLATFTSFHATQDRQLVSFFTELDPLVVTRIVADFKYCSSNSALVSVRSGDQHLEVRLIQERDEFGSVKLRKEILLNGVTRKAGEAIGAFNAVLFLPQMMRIVDGPPDERRRYLNLSFGQVIPHYAADLADYNQSLTQRNALLKSLNERGGDTDQLSFWDEKIALLGSRIIHARINALVELDRLSAQIHKQLSHDQEVLRLNYQPSYDPFPVPPRQYALPIQSQLDRSGQSLENIQRGFLERLKSFVLRKSSEVSQPSARIATSSAL